MILGALVATTVLFAHWPALRAGALSFDDGQYLAENPLVQHPSWTSVRRFCGEVLEPSTVHGYYQPLAMISLMLDYAAGGRVDNLRAFHRTSLALHVVNTLLVMVLLYVLFGRPWIAAGVALLFGVHPMTVEPIPWVGERKTVLAAFFALLCLLAYVRYARRGGWRPYAACMVLYVLALLSKPTSTPLPVVLLLLDFWPLNRLSRRTVLEKIPLLAVGGIFAVITIISQGRTAGLRMPSEYSSWSVPLVVCYDIVFYLWKILWPMHLTSHYPVPRPLALANPAVLAAVVGACVLVVALALSLRWTKVLVTGWLVFMIALFPTMGVVGFTNVLASDKYAYLPAVGYLLILAWLFARLAGDPAGARPAWRPRTVGVGIVAVAAMLTLGTRLYLREWQTSERLAMHMLDLAPDSPSVHLQYANTLKDKGEYGRAIPCYSKALELEPDSAATYNNRGIAYAGIRDYGHAIEDYTKAIELDPRHVMAVNNLGIAYAAFNNYDKALQAYAKAIAMKPDYAEAYHNRGNTYGEMHDYERAIRDYSRAIELKPDFEQAHCSRGDAYRKMHDYGRAIPDFTRAIELKPDFEPAYTLRAHTYSAMGDYGRAIRDYTRAIELKPDFTAYNNRGSAYGQANDFGHAIGDFTRAIELKPDYAKAYGNRAIAYYVLKQYDQAWADVRRCRQLGGEVSDEFIKGLSRDSGRTE